MKRIRHRDRRPRQGGRLIWILLGLVLVLLIVSAVSWVLYLVTRPPSPQVKGWQDPIGMIEGDVVVSELALYPLAGASTAETLDAAIASGEPATAYVLLLHDAKLSDAQRGGRLIQLGAEFVASGAVEYAQASYQQAVDIAVLSPRLGDYARSELLLAAGKGLAELEREEEAAAAYNQVLLISRESPYLPLAHRRELLSTLSLAFSELGEDQLAEYARVRRASLDDEEAARHRAQPGESALISLGDEIVSSPEVGALEENRRQTAYAVLQAGSEDAQVPAELVGALAEALRAEDAAKQALYESELEATSQPGRRIDVYWQSIRWLLLKYQVAEQRFGISLVPEWEGDVEGIKLALARAFGDLELAYEDLVSALPQVSQIGPGTYEWQRILTLAGRTGMYPDYPADRHANALQATARSLIDEGHGDGLYVDVQYDEAGVDFFLSPASSYGRLPASP